MQLHDSIKMQGIALATVRRAVVAAAAASALVAGFVGTGHAAVLCVSASGSVPAGLARKLGCSPTVYKTISDGVAAAASGDTVFVLHGTYSEMVTIPSSLTGLTLMGQNPKNTIIDATGLQNGIFDQAGKVIIDGFTIQNAAHEGILVEGPPATCSGSPLTCVPSALEITDVTIADNLILDNDKAIDTSTTPPSCPASGSVPPAPAFDQQDCGEGIHLDGVAFSTVTGNRVDDNQGGILLTDETNPNHDNLVSDNISEDNASDCGITLPSHPPNGSGEYVGVHSFGVFNDTVAGNLSQGNGDFGVGAFTPTPGTASYKHLIVGNRLVNNKGPGVGFHSHAPGQKLNDSEVVGNVIQGNGADPNPGPGETNGPADPTGIDVYADVAAAPLSGIKIVGNTIKGETNDIWVGAPSWSNCGTAASPCYVVDAHLNNFAPHSVGVNNAGASAAVGDAPGQASTIVPGPSVLVQATNNFWGCAKGPGAGPCASVQGNVTDVPFLTKPSAIH